MSGDYPLPVWALPVTVLFVLAAPVGLLRLYWSWRSKGRG